MIEAAEQQPGGRWSIAGAGVVGGCLIEMLAKEGVAARHGLLPQPDYVLRASGWHSGRPDGPLTDKEPTDIPCPDTDVLFVATPPTVDNEPTLSLMQKQLALGKTVITAEKATLAENFRELTSLPGQLGYWATFAGGARLIPSLQLYTLDPANVREIQLAPNATHTFIFGKVQKGSTLVEAAEMAESAGLVEPGEMGMRDGIEIISNEAKLEIPRKLTILWNSIFPNLPELPPDKIVPELDNEQILKAIDRVRSYRYLVSLYPESESSLVKKAEKEKLPGGFKLFHAGWVVLGGFQRVDRNTSQRFFRNSRGPRAGYYVRLGAPGESKDDGDDGAMGYAAGSRSTATAMLDNLIYIRRRLGLLP